MTWRLLLDAPRTGASNMALDQALFEGVQAGGRPVLRLYRWMPACLSFGRNQVASGIYDGDAAARRGIDVVRRPTGGLAVYHDRELTYSVAIPVGWIGRPRATYTAINDALARGLRRLGAHVGTATGGASRAARDRSVPAAVPDLPVPASIPDETGLQTAAVRAGAGGRKAPRAWSAATLDTRNPCFHEAAPGEVVAAGRKLVGSAVRQEKHTLLQHGSILLDGDQSAVTLLQSGVPSAGAVADPGSSIGLNQILGRIPAWRELCDHVRAGFEESFGIMMEPGAYTPSETERAEVLEHRYRSDAWTWRR